MRKHIISILLVLPVLWAFSQDNYKKMANPEAFKKKVSEVSGSIKTIKSEFTQEKHLSVLQQPAISKGDFYFEKGGKVRWEYKQPKSQSIILNGDKFTMINDGVVAKTDTRASKAYKRINAIMADILHGNTFGNDAFAYAFFESDRFKKVELTPINPQISEHLQSIELYFNGAHKVDELIMREPGGDFTVYRFSNQRYDEKLQPVIFEAKPVQ